MWAKRKYWSRGRIYVSRKGIHSERGQGLNAQRSRLLDSKKWKESLRHNFPPHFKTNFMISLASDDLVSDYLHIVGKGFSFFWRRFIPCLKSKHSKFHPLASVLLFRSNVEAGSTARRLKVSYHPNPPGSLSAPVSTAGTASSLLQAS